MDTPPSPAQISRWITDLASAIENERAAAARRWHSVARDLYTAAVSSWVGDVRFRELLLHPAEWASSFVTGIAVQPENFERIRRANGTPPLADVPPEQDAKEFELRIAEMDFDILTTRQPGGVGAIARFLEKFGEGIQQVEIYVRDVHRATTILRERFKLEPVYPAARAGANGTRVNFFLVPAQGKKVLLELVEAQTER